MTLAPLVSVVLPVYNAGTTLPLALASIVRQSFRDWELILIDDASTDGCVSALAALGPPDSRVRIIREARNQGLAARLNQGIDLAAGRYLARMDQDDIAYPERLETQVKFLETHPDIDLVATRTLLFRDDGSAIGLSPLRRTHEEICATPWRGFFLPHPTWMGRIEWFRRHRYRIPEVVRAEDQDLLLRSYRTSCFACLPEVLLGYRQPGLPLRKVLTARKSLALAQWAVNLEQGHPGHAVLGLLAFALKALADVAIGAVGAQRLYVSRQARRAREAEIDRWKEVCDGLQQSLNDARGRGVAGAAVSQARIGIVASSPMTVSAFLRPHLAALGSRHALVVYANTGGEAPPDTAGATLVDIRIERRIAPLADACALMRLARLFRAARLDAVQSITPKAGLLAMLAARSAGVPVRVHVFTGQVWATRHGAARWLLKLADRLIARCATPVLVDSPSQRDFLVREGVVSAEKARVLGHGSVAGVDATRFKPDATARAAVRAELGCREADVVFLYAGRLNRDKGVLDLAAAWSRIAGERDGSRLVLVGPDEGGLQPAMRAIVGDAQASVSFVAWSDRPERYMAAADVLCLPSYREGFGTVIIEAGACGVPAIASRIYGVTDAIEDGVTGILFPPADAAALADAMARLARDPGLRAALGERARAKALREFPVEVVTAGLVDFYASALASRPG